MRTSFCDIGRGEGEGEVWAGRAVLGRIEGLYYPAVEQYINVLWSVKRVRCKFISHLSR